MFSLRPNQQHPNNRVSIIGGSIAGLFAANLLHRSGWDVQVYERSAQDLDGRGAGIVTHPELIEALKVAGVTLDSRFGIHVQKRVTIARDGSILGTRDVAQRLTSWSHVYRLLRDAFPTERYHYNKRLTQVTQDQASVRALFADGSQVNADLLVGADGLRSPIRQSLAPAVSPQYAGYVAWRGMVDAGRLSKRVLSDIFPYFAFDLPPNEQMLAYPVAGVTNSARRSYNFVWYRPADQASTLADMLRDDHGKIWPEGIPPPLIRESVILAARKAAQDVLSPQFAEVVERTEHLFFQPIFDLQSQQIAFDRVALIGDAAFVARPHCGMGVTKAAGDAIAITRFLNSTLTIQQALLNYEAERLTIGSSIVDHGRALGAYMQAQISTAEEKLRAERYRTPEAVMRETALPPALSIKP